MIFTVRQRLCAAAVAAALTFSSSAGAHATPAVGEVTGVTGAGDTKAASEHDIRIEPGQSLELESNKAAGVTYQIEEGPDSTLPAGWSVLTSPAGLRITASGTAADGEFATVNVTGADGDSRQLRVVVAREHQAPPAETPSSGSSSWVNELVGKIAAFFVP